MNGTWAFEIGSLAPAEFKRIRNSVGLTARQCASLFGAYDDAHVRHWERTKVPAHAAVLAAAIRDSEAVREYFGLTVRLSSPSE